MKAPSLVLGSVVVVACSSAPVALQNDAAATDAGNYDVASDAAPDVTPPPGPPNVIFVLADDFSWNLVQYMPHVLQMQKDGMTFSNYFVTDSLCCPSRTSIFTGRFPHDSGVFTNSGDDGGYDAFMKNGNAPLTFAVALSNANYETAMLGKFLNGYEPDANGVPQGWSEWDVAGQAGYGEFDYSLNENGKVVPYGHDDADYLTDVVSGLGNAFINHANKPFFIEIATFAPHAPSIPAPRDANGFVGLQAPRGPAFGYRPGLTAPKWLQAIPPLAQKDIDFIDQHFRLRAQSVQAIDHMIDVLQQTLVALGQDKNTYIVFSSDNGYHMGEWSLRPGKMTAFETDIHVPLIITGPGVSPGAVVDQITENIDLCSTFSELGGATAPATVNGRSLVPLIHGSTVSDWRDVALVEHHGSDFGNDDPDKQDDESGNPTTYEAIRTTNSVYVEYADGELEYYDLTADPNELTNTALKLSPVQSSKLHNTLLAVENCHDAATCWSAQHLP